MNKHELKLKMDCLRIAQDCTRVNANDFASLPDEILKTSEKFYDFILRDEKLRWFAEFKKPYKNPIAQE